MRTKLVAGNWKMHGTLASNEGLLDAVRSGAAGMAGVQVAVCVPFPYLAQTKDSLAGSNVAYGAQNLSEHEKGAFTGEVSASMLQDFGCRYVIIGHSERRALYGETDALVVAKVRAALAAGLLPIICVGETLEERESGRMAAVVGRQVEAAFDGLGVSALANSVVAYEPVWAIGTGRTASSEQAQEVHVLIRSLVAARDPVVAAGLKILYGGSVKPQNAAELFAMPDVDGGLIGGAALVAADFLAICSAAQAVVA